MSLNYKPGAVSLHRSTRKEVDLRITDLNNTSRIIDSGLTRYFSMLHEGRTAAEKFSEPEFDALSEALYVNEASIRNLSVQAIRSLMHSMGIEGLIDPVTSKKLDELSTNEYAWLIDNLELRYGKKYELDAAGNEKINKKVG